MGNYTLGLFVDLTEVFDSLGRSLLLKKLEHFDITSFSLSLFSNYFFTRSQYVLYRNADSPMLSVDYGVPLGKWSVQICSFFL